MPDYASILRRSVSALPEPSPEMREAVYQRARAALARQLTAVDPPLSTREIEAQHQELEDAVVRLESEYAPEDEPAASFAESTSKDDFLYTAPQPATTGRRQAPAAMERAEESPAGGYDADEDDFDEGEERPSRLPLLIGLVCVLLVVVGASAFLYAERDTLFSFLGSDEQATETAAADAGPVRVVAPEAAADDPDKLDDRLTNGSDIPPVLEPPPANGTVAAAPLPEPPPSEIPAVEPPVSEVPLESLSSLEGDATDAATPGTNLVEQRAIYYYQGSQGQAGQASQGTATWAEITKDSRPAIQATLKIADRDVTVTVTIYKNYDSTLPASHLVEVQIDGTLAESEIQRVPALVLKQTEQARGQPLAGAAVPVTNELFWIALSDDADQVTRNVQLLGEGSWFDIPILFADQTRALLTFEKGIPGDKVFETVMASWTSS